MALTSIQPQWDIGTSAFTAGGQLLGLIAAATQDDVQIAAVIAAEAIGSLMIVDPALIGQAVDALNKNKNFRVESIKLHLGLSKGGISGQLLQSSAALRTFLLISVLRRGMEAADIGHLLYEMLAKIRGANMPPVSSSQLQSFVQSLEGYCFKMWKQDNNAEQYASLVMENAAVQNGDTNSIFQPFQPDTAAKILLAAFEAIQKEEIEQLQFGRDSALWIIVILCWLFPHNVQVLDWKGYKLISSSISPAKVSIQLDSESLSWDMKFWYKTGEPSSFIHLPRSQTYDYIILPGFVPKEMMYVTLRTKFTSQQPELDIVGMLACALMRAAVRHGGLFRYKNERVEDEVLKRGLPHVAFRDVCSASFQSDLDDGLVSLGWPKGSIDLGYVEMIAECLVSQCSELILAMQLDHVLEKIDGLGITGNLLTADKRGLRNTSLMRLALSIAEILVTGAALEEFREFDVRRLLERRKFPIIIKMVASQSRRVEAEQYLKRAFASILADKYESVPHSILAASARGQVLFLRALLTDSLDTPRNAMEAFQIMNGAGDLRWRDTRQKLLFQLPDPPSFYTVPKHGMYQLDARDKAGLPLLKSLRNLKSTKARFSIRQGDELNTIHLRCMYPSTGDEYAQLLPALINWSCALRLSETSGVGHAELQRKCANSGLTELLLKDVAFDPLRSHPTWPQECRAIASYSGDDWSDILRFGTFDAKFLDCVVQDGASIYDCVLAAYERFGEGGWLIMADH